MAVVPVEIALPTSRYGLVTPNTNSALLYDEIDLVDELRDLAAIRLASYHQSVAISYNNNVRVRMFKAGDWVLKKVLPNKRDPRHGKLAETWIGPYLRRSVVGQGAYQL